MLVKPGLL